MSNKINQTIVNQAIANLKAQGYGSATLSAQAIEIEYYRLLNNQSSNTRKDIKTTSTSGRR